MSRQRNRVVNRRESFDVFRNWRVDLRAPSIATLLDDYPRKAYAENVGAGLETDTVRKCRKRTHDRRRSFATRFRVSRPMFTSARRGLIADVVAPPPVRT